MCELFASMCVKCTAFVQYLQKPEEGVGVPGTAELLCYSKQQGVDVLLA